MEVREIMSGKRIRQLIAVAIIIGAIIYGAMSSRKNEQTFAWPLATCSSGETVTNVFAQTFADYVSELSGGKMKIQVYTDSTLGTDLELMESMKDGDIPFIAASPSPQVSYIPQLCVFDTPCVYTDIETFRKNMDNEELMNEFREIYRQSGYRFLGITDQGFRVMTMSKPYTDLSSIEGQKIRVMENKYHIQFWKSVNANPTPMTFSEVYIGLQQGTIDAQENPYEVIVSNRLYEQQDYVIETNHLPHLISLIVSSEFMDSLPEDQQAIIREAAETAKQEARQQSDERIASRIATIEESGSKINRLTEENMLVIRQKCIPVYDQIEKNVSPSLVEAYCGKELEEIRSMVP